MSSRTLVRRLERLEAELAPPDDEPVVRLRITCPGEPDEIFEVRGTATPDRRRQPWSPRRGFKARQ